MAEELAGPRSTATTLTVETKVNMDELIYVLSPKDLPLLHGIGADGVPLLPSAPLDNTIFYWMEEEVPSPCHAERGARQLRDRRHRLHRRGREVRRR